MDLNFIAGNFIYGDLPHGKEYLEHYFKGDVERSFISYYFTFPRVYERGNNFAYFYHSFCDHTGYCCSTRWVRKLLVKLEQIETMLSQADKEFNVSLVGDIKSGRFKFQNSQIPPQNPA